MFGKRALSTALVASVALALAYGVVGVGVAGAATKVAPAEYAAALCSSLGSWKDQVADGNTALENDLQNATSLPEIKTIFVQFLDDAATTGGDVVDQLKAAGVPDVKNGAAVAAVVRSGFTGIVDTFAQARKDADKIPTVNEAKFKKAVKKINAHIAAANTTFGKVFSAAKKKYKVTELDDAFDAEPTCSSL